MSRTHTVLAAVLLAFAAPAVVLADLSKARAEKNLDRRTRLALDNGALQLRLASQADRAGDWAKARQALDEIGESVELAYASQKATGRNPRNARQFKDLELRIRRLLKELEGFRGTLDFDRREELRPLVERIHEIHDQVLRSIVAPKQKQG